MIIERVLAGIVTYEPDLPRLRQNIEAIATQVDSFVVFDNASSNAGQIEHLVRQFPTGTLVASKSNVGIAAALNGIADVAVERGAEWLVTLDQDSVAAADMVEVMFRAVTDDIAMVTPYIVDRNKASVSDYRQLELPAVQYYRSAARKGPITSGALLRLSALHLVGGFDDQFFIDYVDYDLNQRLLQSGYLVIRANRTFLYHEVGQARETWLATPRRGIDGRWHWERFYSFGHHPFRCYYKARNRVFFSRKYPGASWRAGEGAVQIPQQILLVLLFEEDRLEKLKQYARGTWDGLRTPLSGPGATQHPVSHAYR